jgi:hypothetical protein
LKKKKGYIGGFFPLLIRKEEGVDDPIIEKGVGFLTIDPKQTTTVLK